MNTTILVFGGGIFQDLKLTVAYILFWNIYLKNLGCNLRTCYILDSTLWREKNYLTLS